MDSDYKKDQSKRKNLLYYNYPINSNLMEPKKKTNSIPEKHTELSVNKLLEYSPSKQIYESAKNHHKYSLGNQLYSTPNYKRNI